MSVLDMNERFLLDRTGCARVEDINELSLNDLSLVSLDSCADVFQRMSALKRLDVSGNRLTSFPHNLGLSRLRELDMSNNAIVHLGFLQHYPSIRVLDTRKNPLKVMDKQIAAALLSDLAELDGEPCQGLRENAHAVKNQIRECIFQGWHSCFHDLASLYALTSDQLDILRKKFVDTLKEKAFTGVQRNMNSLKEFLIEETSKEIIASIRSGNYVPPQKRSRLDESSEGETDEPLELPPVDQYKPVKCLRCHSVSNEPDDSAVTVWQCVFEPGSSVFASCGGPCICLIDAESGRVVKKYKEMRTHNKYAEDFWAIAWTRLEGEGILAAAGLHGDIKLIAPNRLLNYACIDAHQKAINALVFDSRKPDTLFSGSLDATIRVWHVPRPPVDVSETVSIQAKPVATFRFPFKTKDRVNALALNAKHYWLLAATEYGCYGFDLSDLRSRGADLEFIQPKGNENLAVFVDHVACLGDELVATSCAYEDLIYVWSLGESLGRREKEQDFVKVTPLYVLSTAMTDHLSALACSSALHMVASSGDNLSIWLYALDSVAQQGHLFKPSRMLKWPRLSPERFLQDTSDGRPPALSSLTFSPDGRFVVSGTNNHLLCIWRRQTAHE